MTESQPILQVYGPLHALSSRGLHVRLNARSWKLILPMAPELLEAVRALCGRLASSDAATFLGLLDQHAQRDSERTQLSLQRTLRELRASPQPRDATG